MAYTWGQTLDPSLMSSDPYTPYANANTSGLDFGTPPVAGAKPNINPFTGEFMGWLGPDGSNYIPSAAVGQAQQMGNQQFGQSANGWTQQLTGAMDPYAGFQHGPNNFMERLASKSPYIIGAMALGGAGMAAMGGAGAAGAGAAGAAEGAGTGTLAASSVPAATVSGTELGMVGGGAAGAGSSGGAVLGAGGTGAGSMAGGYAAGGPAAAAGGTSASTGLFGTGITGSQVASGAGSLFGMGGSGGSGSDGTNWGQLIGAGAGALGGYMSGGDQTNSASNAPPPWYTNQWQAAANFGNQAAQIPYTPYGGQRVADFTPDQEAAFSNIRNMANGNEDTRAQGDALRSMLGPYKENPYMQGMIDKTQGDMSASLGKAGLGSGSFGNAGVARQGAEGLANASMGMRFNDYNNYENRRLQAAPLMGQFAGQQLDRQNALLQTGGMQGQRNQALLDVGYQNYQDAQNWPQRQMSFMTQPLGFSNVGNTQSSTQQGNPWASALGGAIVGGQMGQGWNRGIQQYGFRQPGQNSNGGWGYGV